MSEMTITEYDQLVFKERQREAERKHERTLARWKNGAAAIGYTAAAGAVVGIVFIVWQALAGPSAGEVLENEQKQVCIAEKGTWVLLDRGADSAEGTCIFGQEGP